MGGPWEERGEREKEQEIEGGDGGWGGGGREREQSAQYCANTENWNLPVCHLILIK